MTVKLSLERGLEIQKQHLIEWSTKLNNKCFADLIEWVDIKNNELKDGDSGLDVMRGTSLDIFVANWRPNAKLNPILNCL